MIPLQMEIDELRTICNSMASNSEDSMILPHTSKTHSGTMNIDDYLKYKIMGYDEVIKANVCLVTWSLFLIENHSILSE